MGLKVLTVAVMTEVSLILMTRAVAVAAEVDMDKEEGVEKCTKRNISLKINTNIKINIRLLHRCRHRYCQEREEEEEDRVMSVYPTLTRHTHSSSNNNLLKSSTTLIILITLLIALYIHQGSFRNLYLLTLITLITLLLLKDICLYITH